MERWKPVVDHPDYEISNEGNVRKLEPGKGYIKKATSPAPIYIMFNVWNGIKNTKLYVHREMLKAFKPNKDPKLTHVCFKDGNIYNLNLQNLYWTSQRQRMSRRMKEGGYTRGEEHFAAKLTDENVREMRMLWKTQQYSQKQLAERYDIHISTCANILTGRYWAHIK